MSRELQQARVRQERSDVVKLEEEFYRWHEQCPLCVIRGRAEVMHSFDACQQAEAAEIRQRCRMLADGFKYDSYAACFYCGIPQALCRRWVGGTKHQFTQHRQVPCQFPRHFHMVLVVVISQFGSSEILRGLRAWIREEDDEAPASFGEKVELARWGSRVTWGGMETSQLVRNFYRCAMIINIQP